MSIQSIKQLFECPISADVFDNPIITPCGHTFDAPYLTQYLEKNPTCPIDRQNLSPKNLIADHLAQEVSNYLNNTISIFLSAHQKAPRFVELKPSDELNRWSPLELALKIKKIIETCFRVSEPPEDIEAAALNIHRIDPDASKIEQVKKINQHLKKQITKLGLDNRDELRAKLKDPLSKKPLIEPFIAKCGHTFNKNSFTFAAKCPLDQQYLKKIAKNYLIKDALDKLNAFLDPNSSGLEGDEKLTGAWVHLPKNYKMRQVEELAKGLGFFPESAPENAPLFRTSDNAYKFFGGTLGDYEEILEENPILQAITE